MLLKTAVRLTIHEKEKFAGAVAGVSLALLMVLLQSGFYWGYKRDITVVLDSFDADIWVLPKNELAFEVWSWIDDHPYWRISSHPDVDKCGRLVVGYASWRIPASGARTQGHIVGFEFESGIAAHLPTRETDLATRLRPDGYVLVGAKDRWKLGIADPTRDHYEIAGREATIVGFVDEVHLFNTSSLIVTDLENARAFLSRFIGLAPQRVAFILCKCRPGADIPRVIRDLQDMVPEHEVLSKQQLHDRSSWYWENRTGFGPVLLLCAALGAVVGFLIVTLIFYISTVEKLPVFASLKAIGASTRDIVAIVVCQVVIVFVLGTAVAGAGLYASLVAIARTQISVVITLNVVLASLAITFLCLAVGALISIRKLIAVDPGEAFRT